MEMEYEVRLTDKKYLGKGNALLTFACEDIAKRAQPGQFVNISCSCFLKRPFGVCSVDPAAGTFSIGVREVGAGTAEILQAVTGDTFFVLGPLGHGFSFEGADRIITVGGGTGIYPLYFALQKARLSGIPTISVNGFRSREDAFFIEECQNAADLALFSTDAGDYGIKGNVLDTLKLLTDRQIEGSAVFAVGPEIMMRKVSEWAAQKSLPLQVSLEKRMACGIGICLVCVCKVKSTEAGVPFHHVRCCKEGPVMNASEVIW